MGERACVCILARKLQFRALTRFLTLSHTHTHSQAKTKAAKSSGHTQPTHTAQKRHVKREDVSSCCVSMCAQIHVRSLQKCFACNCTKTSFLAYGTFMGFTWRRLFVCFCLSPGGVESIPMIALLDQRIGRCKTTPHSPLKRKLLAKHLHTFLFLTKVWKLVKICSLMH